MQFDVVHRTSDSTTDFAHLPPPDMVEQGGPAAASNVSTV